MWMSLKMDGGGPMCGRALRRTAGPDVWICVKKDGGGGGLGFPPLRRHLPIEHLEARGYTGWAGALAHLLRARDRMRLRDRMGLRLRARAEVRVMVGARVGVSARVRVRWHTCRWRSETRLACCT